MREKVNHYFSCVLSTFRISTESPRWLLATGRTEEAKDLKIIKKRLPENYFEELEKRDRKVKTIKLTPLMAGECVHFPKAIRIMWNKNRKKEIIESYFGLCLKVIFLLAL